MAKVERCRCWNCGGEGGVEYEEARPDPIRGGDLVGVMGECEQCDGSGEMFRAKAVTTAGLRALLTQTKEAMEYIEIMSEDLDKIYTQVDYTIAAIERYERKVGTRNGKSE
tara:strand:+ start:783 stop:1115 length:333 start_codon:yes stop_codon:yes gene_type:complete